eukprot:350651-Pyramimonas_sp.AAC.1
MLGAGPDLLPTPEPSALFGHQLSPVTYLLAFVHAPRSERALLPELNKGTAVRIVVGYQLQTAILMDGWPQGPRHLSGVL